MPERLWHRAQDYLHKKAAANQAENDASQALNTSIVNASVSDNSSANERLAQLMITALSAYLNTNLDT